MRKLPVKRLWLVLGILVIAVGERTSAQIKQLFPGAIAFTTMLEKRAY